MKTNSLETIEFIREKVDELMEKIDVSGTDEHSAFQ